MIKNWISGASIAAIALAHLASGALAAEKPVYAVLLKSLSQQFFSVVAKGVDEGARKADVGIVLAAGEASESAESQVDACETMLGRKPAVMIAAALNSTILMPCLKRFNEMKVPVVDLLRGGTEESCTRPQHRRLTAERPGQPQGRQHHH